jgi:hypothetical protein
MGAINMFSPHDLRPTIEITEFTLVTLSTVVIAIRSVSHTCSSTFRSLYLLISDSTLGDVLLAGLT